MLPGEIIYPWMIMELLNLNYSVNYLKKLWSPKCNNLTDL
jgi:hypothetical protein